MLLYHLHTKFIFPCFIACTQTFLLRVGHAVKHRNLVGVRGPHPGADCRFVGVASVKRGVGWDVRRNVIFIIYPSGERLITAPLEFHER